MLEYAYTVEYEGMRDSWREAAQDALPVLHYEAQVDCYAKLSCIMVVYNGTSGSPRLEQVGAFWRMRWTAEGLAARSALLLVVGTDSPLHATAVGAEGGPFLTNLARKFV